MRTERTLEHASGSADVPRRWNTGPGRSTAAWLVDGELWCLLLIGLLMMLCQQQP